LDLRLRQRLADEAAQIRRLPLPAAAVALQMLAARAHAKGPFATLPGDVTEHAL
jgi:hypothetical protein